MFYIARPYTYVYLQFHKNLFSMTVFFFLDQRGVSQEVSLVTKHGVEAKSYEGVSTNTT